MKNLKKTRRIQVISAAVVALVIATALIGYSMRGNINFFRSPSQVVADPPPPTEVFRIGGLVLEGSLERGVGQKIRFTVTDGGADVPATYAGVLPDLFS
jgi:cytochrome c-type biogenesis protein CcmE